MERFIGRGKEGGEEDKEEEEVVVLHSICLKIREKRINTEIEFFQYN